MPKILTEAQIEQFRRDGCVFPIRVMSEAEALAIRSKLEDYERRSGGPLAGDLRHKTHLLFPWLADLVRNSRIVDAIEDLYGPNLLCWTTNFFIKEANNPAFVSASGLDLLGAQHARCRHRVGRTDPEQSCQRRNDVHSRYP